MKFPLLVLMGAAVLAGCDSNAVQNEFSSLSELKKTNDFRAYDVVDGPIPAMDGPFRVMRKVKHDVEREARSPFHRRVFLNGEPINFKHVDSIGYGFRFVGLQNENGDEGVILLKTANKVPKREMIPNAGPAAARARANKQAGRSAPSADRILERMKEADTDGDGKLAKADLPDRLQERFDEFDANSDGSLDSDETKKLADTIAGEGN